MRTSRWLALAVLMGTGFIWLLSGPSAAGDKEKPKVKVDPAALERTRDMVKMLDALYKTAVISITKAYVEEQADTPARRAAAPSVRRAARARVVMMSSGVRR